MAISRFGGRWFPIITLMAGVLFADPGQLSAQDPATKAPSAAPKAQRAAPRGRLPAYYGDVVTGTQREEIYSIQAQYAAEIRKLEEALLAVIKKRNEEIEKVLSPEQQKQVEKLREDARARAAERAAARAKALEGASPAVPESSEK